VLLAAGKLAIVKLAGATVNLSVAILVAKDSNPKIYASSILSAVAVLTS
jgi:hypothetical protein